MMTRGSFIGSWRLQSWSTTLNGKTSYPFGKDAHGILMYNDDGYMSAVINKPGAPTIENGSLRHLSDPRKAELFDHCFTYAGSWRLERQYVIHHVHHSHNPNFIGTDQIRLFEFDNDRLTLSAEEAIAGKGKRLHTLIWKKAESPL